MSLLVLQWLGRSQRFMLCETGLPLYMHICPGSVSGTGQSAVFQTTSNTGYRGTVVRPITWATAPCSVGVLGGPDFTIRLLVTV